MKHNSKYIIITLILLYVLVLLELVVTHKLPSLTTHKVTDTVIKNTVHVDKEESVVVPKVEKRSDYNDGNNVHFGS